MVEIGEPTFKRDQEKSTYQRSSPGVTGKLRGLVVGIYATNGLLESFERSSYDGLGGKEKLDTGSSRGSLEVGLTTPGRWVLVWRRRG